MSIVHHKLNFIVVSIYITEIRHYQKKDMWTGSLQKYSLLVLPKSCFFRYQYVI